MWKTELLISNDRIVKMDICDVGREMRRYKLMWKYDRIIGAFVCEDIEKITEIYENITQ